MTVFNLAQDEQSTGQAEAWTRPATKQYASLSREHSLALLHRLSTDDGYRSRFEQKPAAALAEIGVPHETIVNLKASCLSATTLADKAHFAQAHQQLSNADAENCLYMIVPNAQLDFGSQR